jgi:hypothetical protein
MRSLFVLNPRMPLQCAFYDLTMLCGEEIVSLSLNAQHERRNSMPVTQLVIVLVVVGVILWLVNSYIPMQSTIKKILNAVVIIAVVLWLLSVFGILDSLRGIRIGR